MGQLAALALRYRGRMAADGDAFGSALWCLRSKSRNRQPADRRDCGRFSRSTDWSRRFRRWIHQGDLRHRLLTDGARIVIAIANLEAGTHGGLDTTRWRSSVRNAV